jgi:sortase A
VRFCLAMTVDWRQGQMKKAIRKGWQRRISTILIGTGMALLGVFLLSVGSGAILSRLAISQFHSRDNAVSAATSAGAPALSAPSTQVNTALWSISRIKAYQESLAAHFAPPLAILRIPKVGIEVPVLDGTDDLILNRGVGRIQGTALPGQPGNLGIAGHRDGFFRGLKDVVAGDKIEVELPDRTDTYVVRDLRIVLPQDTSVLNPTANSSLTLVTCYPFYFVGDAPKRYIVQASLIGTTGSETILPNEAQESKK